MKFIARCILDFGSISFDVPIEADSIEHEDIKLPLYIQNKISLAENLLGIEADGWFLNDYEEVDEHNQEYLELLEDYPGGFSYEELRVLLAASYRCLTDADMFDDLAEKTIGDEKLLALRDRLENWVWDKALGK